MKNTRGRYVEIRQRNEDGCREKEKKRMIGKGGEVRGQMGIDLAH